jgi:hypothetical protein
VGTSLAALIYPNRECQSLRLVSAVRPVQVLPVLYHCAEPFVSRSPSHLHRLRDLRAGRLLSVCSPSAVTPWQAARSRVTSAVRPLSARSTSLVTLQPARLSVVRLLLALPALCY